MEASERTALKAACIQAAAILVASLEPTRSQPAPPPFTGRGAAQAAATNAQPEPDTGACARYARDLFHKLTGEAWDEPGGGDAPGSGIEPGGRDFASGRR